ncbi:hypothetical protein CFC21_004699 [Triticum aestivum]|uniref:Bifunctional inhibitor/plant lipid transfer protein/seed storage helical domain-containing protein n=2 Tax=Triticum aestivum TaxID=4565 RepID=A0A3B5YQX6_WHEAT|nr:gamma-gliadin B-like [Triticum aestivum]KAF6987028.1 hypothetical protein CFC21_004699 [Triticum aestivum]
MKTFPIISLLAMAMTIATATTTMQLDPSVHVLQRPQQPFLEQELNACTEFILQQCSPISSSESGLRVFRKQIVVLSQFGLRSSGCELMQQQCCEQLAQISDQDRCTAIHSIAHAIIVQQEQQQQQQVGQDFPQSQQQQQQQPGQGTVVQPQQQLGQGFIQPQQLAQLQSIMSLVLQTLPTMCNVHVTPYCSMITTPVGSIIFGDGQ